MQCLQFRTAKNMIYFPKEKCHLKLYKCVSYSDHAQIQQNIYSREYKNKISILDRVVSIDRLMRRHVKRSVHSNGVLYWG